MDFKQTSDRLQSHSGSQKCAVLFGLKPDYKMQLLLLALGTKMFFRLPALVTSRYCGAVSPSYKKVPEACGLWYKNIPRAGSPG